MALVAREDCEVMPMGGRSDCDIGASMVSQAADRTSILTLRPARVAKISRASSENLLILPCSKSLRRGCVMPSRRAARSLAMGGVATDRVEQRFPFAASPYF